MEQLLAFGNFAVALAILSLTASTLRSGARPRHIRSWLFFGAASIVLTVHSFVSALGASLEQVSQATQLVFTSLLAVGFLFLYGADREEMERLARQKADAEELATRDALTSLYNMRAFRDIAGAAIDETRGKGGHCAVAILDLDGFKTLNDTQGHPAGDRILQLVATATRANLRAHDIAARYGGDEFVIYMDRCDAAEARRVAHRIRKSFHALSDAVRGGVTLSAGVAAHPEHGPDLATLLAAADQVLLEVKRSGKNDVRSVGAA